MNDWRETNDKQMAAIKAWFEEKTAEDGCTVQVDEYNPETGIAWVELSAGGWSSCKEYRVYWGDWGGITAVILLKGRRYE